MKAEKLDHFYTNPVNRAPSLIYAISGSQSDQGNKILECVIDSVEEVCLKNISGSGLKSEDMEYAKSRLRALRDLKIEESEAIGEAVFKADQSKPNYLNLLVGKFAIEKPEPAHLWVDNSDEASPIVYISSEMFDPLKSSDKATVVQRANVLIYSLMPYSLRLMRQKNLITEDSKKNYIKSYLENIANENRDEINEIDKRSIEGIEVINAFIDDPTTEVFCLGGELIIQEESCNFRQTLLSALEEDVRDYLKYPLSENAGKLLKQRLNINYVLESDVSKAKIGAVNRIQNIISLLESLEASKKGRVNVPMLFRRYVKSELPLAFLR